MPSTEFMAKGQNAYVKLTSDDGHVEWISHKTAIAAEEAAQAISLGFEDRTTITLEVFFNRFMSHYSLPNLKKETVAHYNRTFDCQIRGTLGKAVLAELTLTDVDMLIASLRNSGRTNRQIATVVNILSAILGVAVRWKYIDSNPLDKFDAILIGNAPE